ncbi:hypothetical protein H310_11966 [Aphanomyces invadans]|uniref:Uncharacterized protein n=1 Tax=Aphanomyces invadans TaxID=157072 RepID=A0A024TLV0_9STRA|nr:hypothetical protein H310_11966 [Aphanomyces invadans]ETV94317.1 hypothetical protein H310_11966 [Aphanomyces invadans]|eukprot:XP_008877079.1 hypothetical protein H310_11966 [Aphanomyces invadans]
MALHQPRASVTDDLVAWHGMSVKNFTVMVANGIPLSVQRRHIWMDIIATEMKHRTKAKMSLSFVAYMGTMWEQGSGALGILTDKIDSSLRSSRSGGHKSGKSMRSQHPNNVDEKYIRDIIIELNESNFMVVDSATVPFIAAIVRVVAPEVRNRADVVKILGFLLHREQQPRNPKPCLPFGDIAAVCLDTIESTIQVLLPGVHNTIVQLHLPRTIYWKLMVVPLTEAFPSELRLRMIDHIMVNGCAAMVSVMLVYLQRRQRDILLCTSVEAFERIHEDDYRTWLTQPQFDAFWKECMDVHKSNFSQVYAARNIFMRAKHFTFNMTSSYGRPLSTHNDVHRLHFDDYGWVGFDVDHTLVEFKLDVLLKLSFEKAYTHVQANYMNLRTAQPPVWLPHLAFRGIAVDTIKGNLLYITSTHEVIRGFHGSYELPQNVLGLHYPVQQQRAGTTSYSYLYTNAEIIFGPLYAWLVDQYEAGSITEAEIGYVPLPSGDIDHQMRHLHPESVYSVLCSIALEATSAYYGTDYWRTLSTSPDTVIQINSGVRRMLEMLQKTWKKNVFLLTNGSWEHTDAVMKCAIGTDWSSLFDLVLTKATKEVFFESYHACRFREVLTTSQNARSITAATSLERGRVYEGGNITELTHAFLDPMWKCAKHSKVLYMGDHPLHDITNPAQSAAAWDTVAVIQETSLLFKHLEKQHHRTKQVQTAIQIVLDSVCPCLSSRNRGPQVDNKPMPSTSCFYFDCGGPYTSMGKLINRHAVLCVDSVSKLTLVENTIHSLLHSRLERHRDSMRASGPMTSSGVVTSKVQHQWSNVFRTATMHNTTQQGHPSPPRIGTPTSPPRMGRPTSPRSTEHMRSDGFLTGIRRGCTTK